MKRSIAIICAGLAVLACKKEAVNIEKPELDGEVTFICDFSEAGKVSTTAGVNTWDKGDNISVFSVADGAEAGVSVGTNVIYKADNSGATTIFSPAPHPILASDKYYAYYPLSLTYPSALKASPAVGFAAVSKGDQVTDYRFMPVTVNSAVTVTVDPETGIGTSNDQQHFWATAEATGTGDPIGLRFQPILPLLELGLYGTGTVKTVVVQFLDTAADTLDNATNKWMSGKGIFDISTGVLTTTNTSSSAYHMLTITVKDDSGNSYAELNPAKPIRIKCVVGRFDVTKGLKLTITDKDGKAVIKNIWTDGPHSMMESGKCKHVYQPVYVPFLEATGTASFGKEGGSSSITVSSSSAWSITEKPSWISASATSGVSGEVITLTAESNTGISREGFVSFGNADGMSYKLAVSQEGSSVTEADYYEISPVDLNWDESYILDIKDAKGNQIAVATREFLGSTVNKQAVVIYSATLGVPDYTSGLVAMVTLAGGEPATGNIHGGSVNAYTSTPASVVYTAGTSDKITKVYISADGANVTAAKPSGSISGGVVSPRVLVSPSGQSNSLVKVGNYMWTACGYKTTKLRDGTDLTKSLSDSNKSPRYWSELNSTKVTTDKDIFLYNGLAVGFSNETNPKFTADFFAPEGWSLPSETDWKVTLGGFLGGTENFYVNLVGQSLIFSRHTFKRTDNSNIGQLTYANTWSKESYGSDSKAWMYIGSEKNGISSSEQAVVKPMFEVRLLKAL